MLREGLVLGGIGVTCGALLGVVAGRMMRSLLAGVPATDGSTFAFALGIALLVTTLGGLFPAVRAANVDANALLRGEV